MTDTSVAGRSSSARLHLTPPVATGLAVTAGALLAGQSRLNGQLARDLGAAVPAALISFAVGTVVCLVLVLAHPGSRAAAVRRPGAASRWWYYLGGIGGACLVGSAAYAVPLVGVALVAVAVVAGQTVGGLLVDALGLGPSGRHPVTGLRVLGAGVAVGGLLLGTVGRDVDLRPGVLALVAGAGVLVAFQQAVNGQVQRVTGQAPVAALVSFVVGTLVLALATAVLALAGRLPGLDAPGTWWLYLGGFGGAFYILVAAACVSVLGVLRLALAAVSGQVLGAVVVDLVAPLNGEVLSWGTVVGAVLALVAVRIAGTRPRADRTAEGLAA